jgi:hypothetical protein
MNSAMTLLLIAPAMAVGAAKLLCAREILSGIGATPSNYSDKELTLFRVATGVAYFIMFPLVITWWGP